MALQELNEVALFVRLVSLDGEELAESHGSQPGECLPTGPTLASHIEATQSAKCCQQKPVVSPRRQGKRIHSH